MPMVNVRKIQGSYVSTVPIEDTVPGDFAKLENFIFDRDGLPVVRGGRKTWNTTNLTGSEDKYVRALFHYRRSWVSQKPRDFLIAYAKNSLYRSDMDGTLTSLGITWEDRPVLSFAVVAGRLVVASNSNKAPRPYYWDGAMDEAERLRGAPAGHIVAGHANRLWIVDRGNPSTIHYSAPYDPSVWDTSRGAGYITIAPGDGNEISALVAGFAGEMIVFKDGPGGGSTYRLQGVTEASFAVTPLSTTLGAVSHRCANMIGDKDIMFCSRRGIHSLRRVFEHGDLESAYVDSEISDEWRDLPIRRKKRAVAVDDYGHDSWWLSYDTDGDLINDETLIFNYRHSTPRGNPKVSKVTYGFQSAAVVNDVRSGIDKLMTGGYQYIYEEHRDEAQDQTKAVMSDYDWDAEFVEIDAGDAFAMKAWKDLWISHDNWGEGDMTVTWYGDNRYPNDIDVTMNPANFPTPFFGRNEIRLTPKGHRAKTLVHLREGGSTLSFSISGTRGRTRLRGFRINYEAGKADVTSDRLFPYVEPRQG